jgi:hypothetical protein
MSTSNQYNVRLLEDDADPIVVDPATVGCGFLLFPSSMNRIVTESLVHQALETNKTALWAAVRREKAAIPVHMITSSSAISPSDAAIALESIGRYPDHSIALDTMQLSPDGGRTLVTIYVGFSYKSDYREVIVAGPQKILPGRTQPKVQLAGAESVKTTPERQPKTATAPSQQKTAHKRKWWAVWR